MEEFISTMVSNFRLSLLNPTTLQIVAGTDNAQVAVGISGRWRYNRSTIQAAHPGGAAADYDVFVTASDNSFSNTPQPDTDNTTYAFAMEIRTAGTSPSTAIFRKVGSVTWDGTKITQLKPLMPGFGLASDLSVDSGRLVDQSVITQKIADANVTTPKIADANVTTSKIADLNVTTGKLADLAVATGKLADAAVTSAKIAAGAVIAGSIGVGAVGSSQILDGSIGDIEIAAANKDGAAGTPSLRTLGTGSAQATAGNDARLSDQRTPLDSSVTTAKLVDANVTLAKIAQAVWNSMNGHGLSGSRPAANAVPSGAFWWSSDVNGGTLFQSDGSSWNQMGKGVSEATSGPPSGAAGGDLLGSSYPNPVLANGVVTSAKIADGTIVDADIAGTAAIAYAKLNLAARIVDGDISGSAGIQKSKLGPLNIATADILDGQITSAKITDGTIVDADISATANIQKSKLAALGIVDADISGVANIAKSKLANLAVVNADVAGGAGIAYSKLSLSGSVTNADIAAGAGIAYSKLSLSGSVSAGDLANALKPSAGAGDGAEALRALGSGAGQALAGNDFRLTNARPPTPHVSTHLAGGSDPIPRALSYASGTSNWGGSGVGSPFTPISTQSSAISVSKSGENFTPTVAGWYLVGCSIWGGNTQIIDIVQNGSATVGRGGGPGNASCSALVYCNGSTDYVTFRGWLNDGSTVSISIVSYLIWQNN